MVDVHPRLPFHGAAIATPPLSDDALVAAKHDKALPLGLLRQELQEFARAIRKEFLINEATLFAGIEGKLKDVHIHELIE